MLRQVYEAEMFTDQVRPKVVFLLMGSNTNDKSIEQGPSLYRNASFIRCKKKIFINYFLN